MLYAIGARCVTLARMDDSAGVAGGTLMPTMQPKPPQPPSELLRELREGLDEIVKMNQELQRVVGKATEVVVEQKQEKTMEFPIGVIPYPGPFVTHPQVIGLVIGIIPRRSSYPIGVVPNPNSFGFHRAIGCIPVTP